MNKKQYNYHFMFLKGQSRKNKITETKHVVTWIIVGSRCVMTN